MNVIIATIGKFHLFDLARQLHGRDMLSSIFTGYPRFKLRNENLPSEKIKSFSTFHLLAALGDVCFGALSNAGKSLTWADKQSFDFYVSTQLTAADVFIGHSSVSLRSGAKAKQGGALYICDRGSPHIRYQNDLLKSEYRRHGLRFLGIDERIIAKEEQEYRLADLIFVPSTFAHDTFLEMGIPRKKLRIIPYGVDLRRFSPTSQPNEDAFRILFVGNASIRKGIPYLLEACERLNHPKKVLTLIGIIDPEVKKMIREAAMRMEIRVLGHIPHSNLAKHMGRSHVLVLPSVEDGFGLVMNEAMACSCPVIASTHTGAADLFMDGFEGFIVPARTSDELAWRLQNLADNPDLRLQMSNRSAAKVQELGGWDTYANLIVEIIMDSMNSKTLSYH